MNPIFAEVAGVLARAALLALTGYLQKRHLLTAEQSEKFVAAAVDHIIVWAPGALAVAWGIWRTFISRKKLLVAAASDKPMTENQVTAVVKSGAVTPTVATPKNTIPGVPA